MNQFLVSFVTSFSLGIVGLIGFNILIDPFELTSFSSIAGSEKTPACARLQKAIAIMQEKPPAILLGSSRVASGFSEKELGNILGMTVCNVSFSSARMTEMFAYFQHALYHNKDLKVVVLGVDLFAFGNKQVTSEFDPSILCNGLGLFHCYRKCFMSIQGLRESIQYLRNFIGLKLFNIDYLHPEVDRTHFSEAQKISLRHFFFNNDNYENFSLSPIAISLFHQMASICKERKIDLKVFITPCHSIYWHGIYLKNLTPCLDELKRELVKDGPIWDFSGTHALSSIPFGSHDFFEVFLDSNHFHPSLGKKMMETMFVKNQSDFGYFITLDTCDEYIQELSKNHLEWMQQHSDDAAFVQDIFQSSSGI